MLLILAYPGVTDHTHFNELHPIDVFMYAQPLAKKSNPYLCLFLRYSYVDDFNHFGYAWSHPLEMIQQICNFYGSLAHEQKKQFYSSTYSWDGADSLSDITLCMPCLTTPTWSDWVHLLFLEISNHMQNFNFIDHPHWSKGFWTITQEPDFS